jgi:D-glycero-D-manno-heptose 1,7-bisphosphate phosphatase
VAGRRKAQAPQAPTGPVGGPPGRPGGGATRPKGGIAPPAPAAPFTAFLDRDGVFNPDPKRGIRLARNYRLFPGAGEAFARLKAAGVRTCLVTNQPWVGALTATAGMIRRVHEELQRQLAAHGATLDRMEVAYAPPLPVRWGPWARRKPNAGMIHAAVRAWQAEGQRFDPARAVMVGDTPRDAGCADAAGIPCIVLATTHPRGWLEAAGLPGDVTILRDFPEAVDEILRRAQATGSVG